MNIFECVEEYRARYPDDYCGHEVASSSGAIVIERSKDEKLFRQPEDETTDVFMDRLKRSEETGRNLFYEEWPEFEYIEGADY